MLKKIRSTLRRRKVKKIARRYGSEILVGVLMGLLTDIATDLAQAHLRRRFAKKFR